MTRSDVGRPRAVLVAVAIAVVAVIALAGCATGRVTDGHRATHAGGAGAHLTSHRSAATARLTFAPYDSSGKLTVAVTRKATGNCWATSLADPEAAAYRCFAGNQILDPCFARPGTQRGGTVACIADPWSTATVLTLTKPLPGTSSTAHRIWAFVRSDGAHCVAATGTVPAVAGRNLPYNCSKGTFAALNGVHDRRVQAVFATLTAKSLSAAFVRTLWTS